MLMACCSTGRISVARCRVPGAASYGSGGAYNEILSRHLRGRSDQNYDYFLLGYLLPLPRFDPGTSSIQVRGVTGWDIIIS
jgi:hypothetical protein